MKNELSELVHCQISVNFIRKNSMDCNTFIISKKEALSLSQKGKKGLRQEKFFVCFAVSEQQNDPQPAFHCISGVINTRSSLSGSSAVTSTRYNLISQ